MMFTKGEFMVYIDIIRKVYSFIGFSWLFLMLTFPSDFREIKYLTTIALLLFGFVDFILNKKKIHANILLGLLLWLFYFLLSISIGVNNGFIVDYSLINIYFITPIVAVLLSTIVDSKEKLIKLNRYLIIITLIIVSIDFIYILSKMSIISVPINFETKIFGSVFVTDGKLEFRITNQTSLIFLLPYCVSMLLTDGLSSKKEKMLLGITLLLGLLITIMSGRRAFQIVVIFAFFLTPLLNKFLKNSKTRNRDIRKKFWFFVLISPLIAFLLLIIIQKVTSIDNVLLSFWNTLLSAFDSNSRSGLIRVTQVDILLKGWSYAPFFGHGVNSFDSSFVASKTTPWSYEMVYVAHLFQIGIMGTMIFFFTSFSIVRKNLKKANYRSRFLYSYYFSIAVAFTSFLIAGSSNPMVYYVWAWSIALISYQKINVSIS